MALLATAGDAGNDWGNAVRVLEAVYCLPSKSPATWREVRTALDWLRRFAPSPAAIDETTIAAIVRTAVVGRAPATVNKVLRHCRSICRKLARKNLLTSDPFDLDSFRLRAPRVATKRHQSLRELLAILDQADREAAAAATPRRTWLAKRRRVLVYALSLTGCRSGECLHVRIGDVDMARGVLWICDDHHRLKTEGSAKPVPIAAELRPILDDWLPLAGPHWLLPRANDPTRPWTGGDVANRPLGQVKALGERAGVMGVTLKSLRHSWCTHGRQVWGLTTEQVQRVLRHEVPATQAHYDQQDLDNLRTIGAKIRLRLVRDVAEAG